jgi:hypothetical protein
MRSFNLFKKNDPNQEPAEENTTDDTTKEKIRAFNSIISILAQIQQPGPLFQDNEMVNKNPPNQSELSQLKLSNAFALLAVSSTDVVAAAMYTPYELHVMAWMQDQDVQGSQDNPEAAQAQKTSNAAAETSNAAAETSSVAADLKKVWDRFAWLFATNTPHKAMNATSDYQGPCIVKATPPETYANGSDSKEALLKYLNEFSEKW